ncbi:hypothetical protein PMAYCL1PPCAC_13580 [Pristionchus mayeri]|uniref:Fumarate lyase N-terminal domain-containing protein n=1 Tax=Pristionchus mayeri TaxID=1317129 RepID=A0AAN5CEY5_9BILA|nr:hypothetical protein PMAYCL1PPCAC_13580 [Pristionchus mayeri]
MESESKWESVLGTRYCRGSPLLYILSEKNKTLVWRQLWIWLAEAEKELGLNQITEDAINEMKAANERIDWNELRTEERKLKHHVMAHNHVYGRMCPSAAGIIHLGATSCYVQDNADCTLIREAVQYLLKRMALVLARLGDFAERTKSEVTVGRTHYQAASLTTIGKRTCIWIQDLLIAFKELERFVEEQRFPGIKGATGTQDSFMTLFEGDEERVEALDNLVTEKAGFKKRFAISGQTYTRQQDVLLVNALATFAAAAKKMCMDIRVLQALGELLEPFEESQIGSSAMPYKRNPMKSERVCSLARQLLTLPQVALNTMAEQGLERTLDDSASRRMMIAEGLLNANALMLIIQNISEGLSVRNSVVAKNVCEEMPFLALEKALMYLCQEGVDRQKAHATIRSTALNAKEKGNVDLEEMLSAPFYDTVRDRVLELASFPLLFTGRCVSQTERFLSHELRPTISAYLDNNDEKVELEV